MTTITKYIIVNTNKKRDCYYTYSYAADGTSRSSQSVPFFLRGDYLKDSQGQATDDITRAHLYDDKARAARQVKQLMERFKPDGKNWERDAYPHSHKSEAAYAPFAPSYEVRQVLVTVEIVE